MCDDILKRVKIFLTSWTKLNETVKLKMFNLTKHLDNSELSAANDIHVRLMLDFPSEVSQWMVGIKKLIHELIEMEKRQKQLYNPLEIDFFSYLNIIFFHYLFILFMSW